MDNFHKNLLFVITKADDWHDILKSFYFFKNKGLIRGDNFNKNIVRIKLFQLINELVKNGKIDELAFIDFMIKKYKNAEDLIGFLKNNQEDFRDLISNPMPELIEWLK